MRVISVGVHRPPGEKCDHMVMNTTEKNTLGRTIYKGPRGGLYVLGPTGSKIRTFKKGAPVPPPAPPSPVRVSPPKNTHGRVIHTGVRGGRYVLDGTRKIYKFTPATTGGPVVTAPVRRSPTSAERNARLLEIRRRLNNLRRERLARVPAARANVNRRLRNVLGRVRERIAPRALTGPVTTMNVEFCHSVASVPRKPCRRRKVRVRFHESPLINSGVVVSTRRKDIDQEWITRQEKYIKQLNDYDFWTAQAHTNRSHSWIGPYLYESGRLHNLPASRSSFGATTAHMVPLWPQVRKLILDGTFAPASGYTWVQTFLNTTSESERYKLYERERNNVPGVIRRRALDMYRADLKRIIERAPRSKKTMVVYRGTGFDIFKGSTSHWHTLKSFCSAAYDLQWAIQYEQGYIQRITILPGTPALFVAGMNQWQHGGEYEIMVNVDTKYLIRYRNVKRAVDAIDYSSRTRKIKITDVTIAR